MQSEDLNGVFLQNPTEVEEDDPTQHYTDPQGNPFTTLKFHEPLPYKILKYTLGILIFLPLRVLLTLIIFLILLFFLYVGGSCGLENNKPLPKWRRVILWPVHILGRLLLFVWGFYWIPRKGVPQLYPNVAPIVIANHVSFFDGLYLFSVYNGSGISRIENKKIPVVSALLHATQSILIDRSNTASRKNGFQNIVKRAQLAHTDPLFKQIIMFPEGTSTNGTALVQFKVGAFAAGVPVQPVCLTYPNKYCDVTWPPNVNLASTIFHMFCQFTNYMEADFLPPYEPSDQEKADPQFFADNVRALMAQTMNLPTTEHSFDDCKLMYEATKLHLPETVVTDLQMEPIGKLFDLKVDEAKTILKEFSKHDSLKQGKLTLEQFAHLCHLPPNHSVVIELFEMIDQDEDGMVSFKEYILGLATLRYHTPEDVILNSWKIFDVNKNEAISLEEFTIIMKRVFEGISDDNIKFFFNQMDTEKKEWVTYDQFSNYAKNNPHYIKIAEKLIQAKKEREKLRKSGGRVEKGKTKDEDPILLDDEIV